jgi:hypothetical protein
MGPIRELVDSVRESERQTRSFSLGECNVVYTICRYEPTSGRVVRIETPEQQNVLEFSILKG